MTEIDIAMRTREKQESLRIATLAKLKLLDTQAERDFDALTVLTQKMLNCKIAMVTLLDTDRQWFKARCGMSVSQIPRSDSFCAVAVEEDAPLVVPNLEQDTRFSANPFVTGSSALRFYAGIPLHAAIAHGEAASVAIGTLCVADDHPRTPSAEDLATLQHLACIAETLIDARLGAREAERLLAESQAAVARLDREQRQFRQAERMANIGSWRLTLGDGRTEWSDQVFAIHELPPGEMPLLEKALDFYPVTERDLITCSIGRTIATGEAFAFEADLTTARGNKRRVRSMGEIERVENKPVALIGVVQDITAQHRMEQSLRRIASIDDLTQIANRARCNEVLSERMAWARRHGEDLALLLIDLDGFKTVNDRCGHAKGDALLRLVGSRLKAAYLSECFVARLGGDEFVVVISSPEDCERLDEIVARLLNDLRQRIEHPDGTIEVSGTIGIGWLDETTHDRSELMQQADCALYSAKQKQRGTAETYRGGLARRSTGTGG